MTEKSTEVRVERGDLVKEMCRLGDVYSESLAHLRWGAKLGGEEAIECLHIAIAEMLETWRRSGPTASLLLLPGYLATSAYHVSRRPRRKDGRLIEYRAELRDDLAVSTQTPEEELERNEMLDRVWISLGDLPESQRFAVLLWFIGLDAEATASILGVSVGAARALKHAGLVTLRHKFRNEADSA